MIAANVLHATRDLEESLAHCRRLLAPSGILVAMEETEPQGWLDLTFGLLPGWWRFEDAYRPHHPLAPREVWSRVLADAGFSEPSFVDNAAGSVVIVARGPSQVETETGVFVLSGSGELSDAVAEEAPGALADRARGSGGRAAGLVAFVLQVAAHRGAAARRGPPGRGPGRRIAAVDRASCVGSWRRWEAAPSPWFRA